MPVRPSFSTPRATHRGPMRTRWHDCWAKPCHCASSRSPRGVSSHACSEADMGLLALFRKTSSSANVAKERLRIIVAQERNARGGPDYLPTLRRELLEVIRRYVNVDPSAVQINLGRDDGHEVLELSVALPEESRDGSTAKR